MRGRVRLLVAALLLAAFMQPARAQESLVFDGERYVRVHRERQSSGAQMAQFVRERETLENWTQSVAIYRYTNLGDDPTRAALELRDSVKEVNPDAQSRLVVHSVTRDAVIDFLTWPPDGSYLELNVMRYAPAPGAKGLLAFRFVHRFPTARKEDAAAFTAKRVAWRDQVLKFELAKMLDALAD